MVRHVCMNAGGAVGKSQLVQQALWLIYPYEYEMSDNFARFWADIADVGAKI